MNYLRQKFVIIIIVFFFFGLQAQSQIGDYRISDYHLTKKPSCSLKMGSQFATGMNGNSIFGTSISPSVIFPVKPKFSIEAGISYQSLFLNSRNSESTQSGSNHFSLGSVYVSGLYELNPKVTLRGTAWKQFDLSSSKLNPRAIDFEAEGINIGVQYQVTEKFRVEASFEYSNGNHPCSYQFPGTNSFGSFPSFYY
jgi:predicted porin